MRLAFCEPQVEHCHLVVFDPTHTWVLASRFGARWTLPCIRFDRRHPADPIVVEPDLDWIGLKVLPVHEARIDPELRAPGDRRVHHYLALEAQESYVRSADLQWELPHDLFQNRDRILDEAAIPVGAAGSVPETWWEHITAPAASASVASGRRRIAASAPAATASATTAHAATAHAAMTNGAMTNGAMASRAIGSADTLARIDVRTLLHPQPAHGAALGSSGGSSGGSSDGSSDGWFGGPAVDAHAIGGFDWLAAEPERVPIQEQALRAALMRCKDPVAPFDSPRQVHAAIDWAKARIAELGETITGEPVHCRVERFDQVIEFPTTAGRLALKAGPWRITQETLLTQALHALMPDHLPPTLFFSAREHRWLTPRPQGVPLSALAPRRPAFVAHVHAHESPAGFDEALWIDAVHLLAELQRRTLRSRQIGDLLFRRHYGPPQQHAVRGAMLQFLQTGPHHDEWPPERLDVLDRRIREANDNFAACGLPGTWTPADFIDSNIYDEGLQRRGQVARGARLLRVGDIEDSYLAVPTLAVSRLFEDLESRLHVPHETLERLADVYVSAWYGALPTYAIRDALRETTVVGRLFEFRRLLDRHARRLDLWSSDGHDLPPTRWLHAEAHRLANDLAPPPLATHDTAHDRPEAAV